MFLLALSAALLLTRPSLAEEQVPGLVKVASRLFLAPDLSGRYADSEDFLPRTEMDWLKDIAWADPLLGSQRPAIHVYRLNSAPAWLFSDEGMLRGYGDRDNRPEALRHDGLDVQGPRGHANPQAFMVLPEGPAPGLLMSCGSLDPATLTFTFCQLLTYPPDPAITLVMRLYDLEPWSDLAPDLPAIVERLREIALCLDVTEAPPSNVEAALEALLAATPRLEGCGDRLSS